MTTATLTITDQLTYGDFNSGQLQAGHDAIEEYGSVFRFSPPAGLSTSTINTMTLDIDVKEILDGGECLVRVGLVDNDDELSIQDRNSATSFSWKYLHTSGYTSPPAGSQATSGVRTTLTIDLQPSAIAGYLNNHVIVAFQYANAQGSYSELSADGIGDTTPPTIDVDYTLGAGTFGALDATEDDDTLNAGGAPLLAAEATPTESDDTLTGVASVLVTGTLTATNDDDTLTALADPPIVGTLTATEADDTLESGGASFPRAGHLNVTEADDLLTSTAAPLLVGTLDTTEADDTLTGVGLNYVNAGASTITEADDTLTGVGSLTVTGTLTVTEADDTTTSVAGRSVRRSGFMQSGFIPRGFSNSSTFLGA